MRAAKCGSLPIIRKKRPYVCTNVFVRFKYERRTFPNFILHSHSGHDYLGPEVVIDIIISFLSLVMTNEGLVNSGYAV